MYGQADRQTDMPELIVALCNFGRAPKTKYKINTLSVENTDIFCVKTDDTNSCQ
jgi:hypothetical protein